MMHDYCVQPNSNVETVKKMKTAADMIYTPIPCRFGSSCAALNCTNTKKEKREYSFFSFPKDETRCMEWITRSNRTDLLKKDIKIIQRRALCEVHFEASQFMNPKEKGVYRPKKRLIHSALPSIFSHGIFPLPVMHNTEAPPKSTPEKSSVSSKTTPVQVDKPKENIDCNIPAERLNDKSLENQNNDNPVTLATSSVIKISHVASLAPKTTVFPVMLVPVLPQQPSTAAGKIENKEKLIKLRKSLKAQQQKVYRLKKQNAELKKSLEAEKKRKREVNIKEYINMSGRYISGQCRTFFISQIKMFNKTKQERKWTKEDREFALSIYKSNSKVYRELRNVFAMPTIRTLQRHVQLGTTKTSDEPLTNTE